MEMTPNGIEDCTEASKMTTSGSEDHTESTNMAPSGSEDCTEATAVATEQKFGPPLNKFITGGALRALASLTHLDLSEVESPRATSGDLQPEFGEKSRTLEQLEASQLESVTQLEKLMSFNSGPFLPQKLSKRSTGRQGSCTPKSEEHSVLMRANMVYEPVVKEAPPVATTLPLRKKIKMKAPIPKLSSRAKKPLPNANDEKDISILDAGEQPRDENGQKEDCSVDDCMTKGAADFQSLLCRETINDEAPEDEESFTVDTLKPNTCVVTHREHSIDVPELQDPPCRRRWPKVLPAFDFTERSPTSSTSESLQEERMRNGLPLTNPSGNAELGALKSEDIVQGQATSPSSKDAIDRLAYTRDVSADNVEETNTQGSDQVSGQQNFSSNDALVFKTRLKISLPSASVREISINSASKAHQQTLPDSHPGQGEDGELKRLGNEFQSNSEIPSSLSVTHFSFRAQNSEFQEEATGIPSLQKSNSCPPGTNRTAIANESPEAFDLLDPIPERKREETSNESSPCTNIVSSKNSNTEAIHLPALVLAKTSPGQLRRTTPEKRNFGRGMWSSTHLLDETFAERASLSSEKLSSILSYLGHVEESNRQENYNILQKTKQICNSPRTVLEHEDSVSLADSTFTTTLTTMSNRSATDSNANSGDGDGSRNATVSLFEGVRKKIQQYKDRITGQESQNAELIRELERVKANKQQALSL